MDNNSLIYGKSDLTNVVSIEHHDGYIEIFKEIEDDIVTEFIPSKYWMLSSKPLGKSIRLKGDLHYKWGKQFISREEFLAMKKKTYGADVYFINNEKESAMVNKGITYFKGMNVDNVSVLSFDLETTTLDPRLPEAKILLISTTYRRLGKITKKLFSYDEYENQGEMIDAFCSHVRFTDPSCIIGHNCFGFDLGYLRTICEKSGTSLKLGRDESVAKFDEWESKFRKEGSQFIHYHKCRIYGREIIDTMFLAIKYDVASRKYNSYGLKNIINQEGLEKSNRTFYDANQIRHNYMVASEWEKIKQYCIDDSDDALALYDLMIKPFFASAKIIPMSFQRILESASGSQLNSIMVRSYLQKGHSIPKADEGGEFSGGLSIGFPGIYSNAFKVDIASMYPSIMLQYEVYPKHKDPDKHFLIILEHLTKERLRFKQLYKETKIEEYDSTQNAMKILINSGFGFMGAPGLNFNYMEGAGFITAKGQEILKTAIKWATGKEYVEKEGLDKS